MGQPSASIASPTIKADDRFWTLSNEFSLLRVVLAIPTLWLIWAGPDYKWYMFGCVMIMIATDVLDGYVARKRNERTAWGKILDPLADKVAIDSITIILVLLKGLPWWVGGVVVGRDVLIVLASALLASRQQIVMSSNLWGKLTTLVMSGLLLAYAMDSDSLKLPFLWMAAFLLFASFVSYGLGFAKLMRDRKSQKSSDLLDR
jgi:cardiolipin synthase